MLWPLARRVPSHPSSASSPATSSRELSRRDDRHPDCLRTGFLGSRAVRRCVSSTVRGTSFRDASEARSGINRRAAQLGADGSCSPTHPAPISTVDAKRAVTGRIATVAEITSRTPATTLLVSVEPCSEPDIAPPRDLFGHHAASRSLSATDKQRNCRRDRGHQADRRQQAGHALDRGQAAGARNATSATTDSSMSSGQHFDTFQQVYDKPFAAKCCGAPARRLALSWNVPWPPSWGVAISKRALVAFAAPTPSSRRRHRAGRITTGTTSMKDRVVKWMQ